MIAAEGGASQVPTLVSDRRALSGAEVESLQRRLAGRLLSLGLTPGDRVAVLAANRVELLAVTVGTLRAGIVPVPISPLLTPTERDYLIQDSGARVLFTDRALENEALPVVELDELDEWASDAVVIQEQTWTSVQDRRVGMVFQHYALFRHMNVRQNIAFGLSVRKASKAEQKKRVDELLELVQLGPYGSRFPEQLSGGQRQRVALARALAPRPKVLLLDEPFGALDARVRQDLRKWLDELHRELGVTSILVTHDQEEALELAHRVVVMHEGEVQQVGSPEAVYNQPATPFVAGFVGSANVINGLVINGHVQFGEQQLDGAAHLSDGMSATAYVRPHDVTLSLTANGSNSRATVQRIADLGWASKVSVALSDGQKLDAHSPNDQIMGIHDGSVVFVDLRNAKVFSPEGATPSDELAAV